MSGAGKLTPMMRQYQGMKKSLPDGVLLMFRLGDFYEMFFDDAVVAADILGLTLTKRNGIPMCGVPHHAAKGYIARLVKEGRRVAIGEQTSEPKPGKIVERAISQVVSAGTVDDVELLENNRPNYLAAVCRQGDHFGLAAADLSTGDFRVASLSSAAALADEIARLSPVETLIPDAGGDLPETPHPQPTDGWTFLPEHATPLLCEHFGVHSLDGFGIGDMPAGIGAAGAIIHYLRSQMHRDIGHLRSLTRWHPESHVFIDAASQEHLELVESRAGRKFTLLHAVDRTITPMGARLLRHWILHPLAESDAIRKRQDGVTALLAAPDTRRDIRSHLAEIRDIERAASRLSQGSGNARDLHALARSLEQIPALRQLLESASPSRRPWAAHILPRLHDLRETARTILNALVEEPPATLKDGGLFREGHDPELDTLRRASTEGRQWIAELQQREIKRTGIKSLKVRYNNVFGYFIEVTKANLANVPEDYTRKQTTVNSERFITPELKEIENRILGSDERSKSLEYEHWLQLRESTLAHLEAIQETAAAIAEADVLAGFAELAALHHYTRPDIDDSLALHIHEGRHPVLDQTLIEEKFVPNDTDLDGEGERLVLITGPNMAGKSTYIRQVALLVLLAQTGSYIPATSAQIGAVDRIFTRVGATDDLARGQSTFMVEMNETSMILNNATPRSLVILDEIGRGTSTFDGLSIAWSVAEHIDDVLKCRTLFATHYHELTALGRSRPGIRNANVAVREWNERIIFLRRIVDGAADRSYGIQVARLAGIPKPVIDRAKTILSHLEGQSLSPGGGTDGSSGKAKKKRKRKSRKPPEPEPFPLPDANQPQLDLFS